MIVVKFVMFAVLLFLSPFLQASDSIQTEIKTYEIESLDTLIEIFTKYNYTSRAWKAGHREVPRFMFEEVGENWKKTSKYLPVKLKKEVFFRLMAPLVLISNENILKEREVVKTAAISSQALILLAQKYNVIDSDATSMTEVERIKLLNRVDIMPPSLALAQAAEESGWATSRFTEQGNAFFGQWDFSGNGMVPKQQRKELGNYGIRRFDSPLASVEGYMLNINVSRAYQKLRDVRANLRRNQEAITGLVLADTLDKYSERGQAYIDSIKTMITYNRLQEVDECYLSTNEVIRLVSAKK